MDFLRRDPVTAGCLSDVKAPRPHRRSPRIAFGRGRSRASPPDAALHGLVSQTFGGQCTAECQAVSVATVDHSPSRAAASRHRMPHASTNLSRGVGGVMGSTAVHDRVGGLDRKFRASRCIDAPGRGMADGGELRSYHRRSPWLRRLVPVQVLPLDSFQRIGQ